ncbi:hypothetical protein BU26DRAFT_318979 [Trematosphaeria pertusa]|uniref:RRM domain-containing protein n=1 Tax=Trematosphaeria pertusa TaxID=390896 RepID=A0A6A6IG00_9PLEO|nr:uncharacterized protein BU26DRAFT_318979 [Trematosphaeria pertusa]KAF2249514.1 hypothetical protein BU26DRAFT_318979 [Trematosphaeria pertusa]
MSNSAEPHTDEEVETSLNKVDRKKDKKGKKKSRPTHGEADQDAHEEANPSKKRKRDPLPEEIEIDVSAPEPASKKAARKAKKAKLHPTSTGAATATNGTTDAKSKPEKQEEEVREHTGKRSVHGVWIGNLPWSATKESLLAFLTENSEIKTEEITRVFMPAPTKAPRPNWTTEMPQNKGFAYVDFSTELAMYSAIALTETKMDRRALLIKNAKSFEGRPDKPKSEQEEAAAKAKDKRQPSRKVFVGNLGFETSKEDLEEHFGQCGAVENIHMATFEDSGKCKGFAWVTFEDVEAATSAVNGYVYKLDKDIKTKGETEEEHSEKKSKKRKFRLNKLLGRDLRCEFAEDPTTRYQKRYAKEKPQDGDAITEESPRERPLNRRGPYVPTGKPYKQFERKAKVDPRSIKPGAAHTSAQRASYAIAESKGKKITFD